MSKKWKQVFNNAVGLAPSLMNSSLFSAQTRPRYYWTNLKQDFITPIDKNIELSSILEKEVEDKYYLSEKAIKYINREDRNNKKINCY